jgi:hypothetical protein
MHRLVIHVGTHKTGTTALQDGMAARADALLASGWLYPGAGRAPLMAGHHNLAWALSGDRRLQGNPVGEVMAELAGHGGPAILSSEDFTGMLPDRAAAFLDLARSAGFAPEFVVLLREQSAYAVSLYMTAIQLGYTAPLSDFLGSAAADGAVIHHEWRFPFRYDEFLAQLPALVRVGSYDALRGGLGPGFAALAGLPAGVFAAPLPRANQRIDAAAGMAVLHRAWIGALPSPAALSRYAEAAAAASPDGLTLHEARGFAAAFAGANAALARRWGVAFAAPTPRAGTSLIPLLAQPFICADPAPDEAAILRASTSWRITAPLRALGRLFKPMSGATP